MPPATLDDPYAAFAPHYDSYTEHPAFARWIGGLEALARRHGLRGRRLLDAGCGTGRSLLPLLELGYTATGCDGSAEMLAVAQGKLGGRARLVHADLAALPVLGAFDLVTCLNDVVNCLLEPEDVARALGGLAANLAPGGVLVFDANLVAGYRAVFGGTHVRTGVDCLHVWRGEVGPDFGEGDLATAAHDVLVRADGDLWRRTSVRHIQRHHPHELLATLVARADLTLVQVLGDANGVRDGGPPDPARHERAIYVSRR